MQGSSFAKFRSFFQPTIKIGFIVPSYTFDNVKGKFPISFKVWDLNKKFCFSKVVLPAYDEADQLVENKLLYATPSDGHIGKWISLFKSKQQNIGWLIGINGSDFQQNGIVYISSVQNKNLSNFSIDNTNIIQACIYLSLRRSTIDTWLNHSDQFLCPNDGWSKDKDFQADCLTFALFHEKNCISCEHGVNHWIPFREAEVDAKEKFESSFMADFIAGKLTTGSGDLFSRAGQSKARAIEFSQEAQAVFDAGRDLWRYYHAQPRANPNASFYDIRGYFQGFTKGRMNPKSTDEEYNRLIQALRRRMKFLAAKIEPKIYEYGFLMK